MSDYTDDDPTLKVPDEFDMPAIVQECLDEVVGRSIDVASEIFQLNEEQCDELWHRVRARIWPDGCPAT